jgi:hypothetical protein
MIAHGNLYQGGRKLRPIPQMEQKEFLRAKDEKSSCSGGRLLEMVSGCL